MVVERAGARCSNVLYNRLVTSHDSAMAPRHPSAHPPTSVPPNAGAIEGAILRSALAAFARYGYTAASVRSIAADAGVTAPMINYYFTSKADLYAKVIERAGAELAERAQAASAEPADFRSILRGVAHAYVDFAAEEPDLVRFYFRSMYADGDAPPGTSAEDLRSAATAGLAIAFERGVATGGLVLRAGYSRRDLERLLFAVIESVISRGLIGRESLDDSRAKGAKRDLERFFDVVTQGILAPAGRKGR